MRLLKLLKVLLLSPIFLIGAIIMGFGLLGLCFLWLGERILTKIGAL